MDYSARVNSKQGSGGVADIQEANVHRRNRIKELLTTQVLNLDNDPYVFRNHLGLLECRLCLTTHVSESSYISHLGGKKHLMNLEKRRILDDRAAGKPTTNKSVVSITNIPKRSWTKIGKPSYKVVKIRHPETHQLGLLVTVKYPQIAVDEPFFAFMNYYELTSKNQNAVVSSIDKVNSDGEPENFQYLVISAEPYENVCLIVPSEREIDKPSDSSQMSDTYWWYWDGDIREFYLQFMYKAE